MKLISSAVLVICTLIVFWPIWNGRFYLTGDMRDVTIPIESFFKEEQMAYRLPAWMPDAAFGFPIIASAQIGFFYPPLLIARFLPLFVYIPLIVVLHTMVAAIGTYVFARKLGQSQTASILTAACTALGAFAWQHITHLNIYLALAWLPWQLLAVKKITQKPMVHPWGVPWAIGIMGLVVGIPFLIGQMQIPALMAGFSLLYYLVLASQKISLTSAASHVILISLLAAATASVQVLPTLELVKYSSRGTGGDFDIVRANQHSYPIYHLPTLVFPRFFGQDNTYWGKRLEIEYGFFIGTAPLILAAGTILRFLKKKSASLDQSFFVSAAIISFLLALGSLSPFRLIGLEPSLWVFSAPARWLFITSFCLALLAGWGFDNLHPKTILKNRWLLFIAWLAVIGTTFLLALPNTKNWILACLQQIGSAADSAQILKLSQLLSYAGRTSLSLFSPYTWLPIGTLTLMAFTPRPYLKKTILAVSLLELLVVAGTTSPTAAWSTITSTPKTLSALPHNVLEGQARLFTIQPEGQDTGAWFTNPASRADSQIRQQQKDLLVPLVSTLFHIPGVSWPASLDIQSTGQAIASLDKTDTDALAELNIGAITSLDSGRIVVTANTPKPRFGLRDTSTDIEKEMTYNPSTAGSIKTTVEAERHALVTIRDTWYPGWRAYLDNQPVAIEKTGPYGAFRAIRIPSGQHSLLVRYEPSLLYVGLAVTVLAALASCAAVAVGYKLRT